MYNGALVKDGLFFILPNSTYCFDAQGIMMTGWLKDAMNNLYFFEDAKNTSEGRMCGGWKQMITTKWYYFGFDGKLYRNTMTPDGSLVGADGSYTE